MLTVLAVSLLSSLGDPNVVAHTRVHLVQVDVAPPPAPPVDAPRSEADLAASIDDLNRRITALSPNWPAGAAVLVALGGASLYIALLTATVAFSSTALLLVTITLGIIGAVCVGIGVAVGLVSSGSARLEREALIRERDALKQQLQNATNSVPLVLGPAAPLTVATF